MSSSSLAEEKSVKFVRVWGQTCILLDRNEHTVWGFMVCENISYSGFQGYFGHSINIFIFKFKKTNKQTISVSNLAEKDREIMMKKFLKICEESQFARFDRD